MPGPIYMAGRTPLTSAITAAGGLIQGPLQSALKKLFNSTLETQPTIATGARVPPTFPDAKDLAEGIGTRAFAAVTTLPGDYLVVEAILEGDASANGTLAPSGGGLTYVTQNDSGQSGGGDVRIWQWTTLDAAGGSRTVTITPTVGTFAYRARLTIVRGSDGPGTGKGFTKTAQSLSVTRQSDDSAMFMAMGDWSAFAVGSPVWTPGGATVASQTGTQASYVFGRWDDSNAAGTAVHGITSPTFTTPSFAVLEMRGTSSGATEVFGAATLSAETTLDATGTNTAIAASVLSAETTLVAVSNVTTTGSAVLSGETTLTAVGSRQVNGTAVLSAETTLTAVGQNTVKALSVLSAQTTLTAVGANTVLAASVLSGQTTMIIVGSNNVRAAAVLSSETTLTAVPSVTVRAASILSGETTLTVTATVTGTNPSAALSAQTSLTATGKVTTSGVAVLSGETTLVAVGSNTVKAAAVLIADTNAVIVSKVTTTGSAVLSAATQLTAIANTSATGANSVMSAQTTLTATGSVTVKAAAVLSGQTTLDATGKATTRGIAVLSANGDLTAQGARGVLGIVVMSAQTALTASGFIPAVVTGLAQLSAQSIMIVVGDTSPPWVFPFIEFTDDQATQLENSDGLITIYIETQSGMKTITFESADYVTSWEG